MKNWEAIRKRRNVMAPISTTPEFFREELRPGPPWFKGKEHALAQIGVEIV